MTEDFKGADKINAPISGGWESRDRKVEADPVLKGSGIVPDNYFLFQFFLN